MAGVRCLSWYGGALNIEGPRPFIRLHAENLTQDARPLWLNAAMVLDCPLADNREHKARETFAQIEARQLQNAWPILENAIVDINEHQMLAFMLAFVQGALELARTQAEARGRQVCVCVHVHQFAANAAFFIAFLRQHVQVPDVARIEYTHDQTRDASGKGTFLTDYACTAVRYAGVDMLISLSQCAGIDQELRPGDWVVADHFRHMNISCHPARLSPNELKVHNAALDGHLIVDFVCARDVVNRHYRSANPAKAHHRAHMPPLVTDHAMLVVDKIWCPVEGDTFQVSAVG